MLRICQRGPSKLHGHGTVYSCDCPHHRNRRSRNVFGNSSEEKFRGKGVSACATCDGFFFRGQRVAVVAAATLRSRKRLYLSHIATHVTLVHRRDRLRAEKILQKRYLTKSRPARFQWYGNQHRR